MPETVILTAAPPSANGRRLSYIVEGEPAGVTDAVCDALNNGHFYEVPDRDVEDEYTYVNPEQIIAIYRKPEAH